MLANINVYILTGVIIFPSNLSQILDVEFLSPVSIAKCI